MVPRLTCTRRRGSTATIGAESQLSVRCRRATRWAGWARRAKVLERKGSLTLGGRAWTAGWRRTRLTRWAVTLGVGWRSGRWAAETRVGTLDRRFRESSFAGRTSAFRAGRGVAGALVRSAYVHLNRRRAVAAARHRLAQAAATRVAPAAAALFQDGPRGAGLTAGRPLRSSRIPASRGRAARRSAIRVRGVIAGRWTAAARRRTATARFPFRGLG